MADVIIPFVPEDFQGRNGKIRLAVEFVRNEGHLLPFSILEASVHFIPYLGIVGGNDFRHILAVGIQEPGYPGPPAFPGPFRQIQQLGCQFRIPAGLEIP